MSEEARLEWIDFDGRKHPQTDQFCIRCQKDIRHPDNASRVFVLVLWDNGANALDPVQVSAFQRGELTTPKLDPHATHGWHLIGTECVRHLGKRWVV